MSLNSGPAVTQTPNPQALLNNNAYQLLFVLRAADMRNTKDQQFTKVFDGIYWDPQLITARQVSGAYNTACLGGIFTGAGKTGSAIVAVGQSYSTMTGPNTHTHCTVQASTTTFSEIPYLSLSTGNGAALTADFFIWGPCLDRIV